MSSLHFRTRCILRCFLVFLLCFTGTATLHAATYDNFNYTVANGAATITGYTGAGGAVTIPSSVNGYPVTSIGINAFVGCTGLTSVTIPNSVTVIGVQAFTQCTGLTSLTIPNNVTSIGQSAFYVCTGLTSVTIGSGVTSIGDWVFANCTGLTSVTIPNSVTEIGQQAFIGCTGLTSVTIPNSVTSIGEWAFQDCTGLTSASIPERFLTDIEYVGLSGQVAVNALIAGIRNSLASDPEFIAALAKQIISDPNNFGISIKQNQTLSFKAIPAQTYAANKKVTLAATSSAKLTPIIYTSSSTGVATVSGNIVTLKAKGNATITASQAGNSTYNSTTSSQVLTVK